MRGHYEPDDQAYVDAAEIAHWRTKDPIETAKTRLLERKEITPAEFEAMELRAREIVDRAAKFAAESPFPRPEELLTDVYA